MPDFSLLLKKPAGEAKRPPPMPAGDYYAVVKNYEVGDANRNKTPYVRLGIVLQDWPDNQPNEWIASMEDPEDPTQTVEVNVSKSDIDLSKRQMRRDLYLTDDSLWRLDAFIRSCGIDPRGRDYDEIIPELVGQPVIVEVQQYLNQQTNQTGNQIGAIRGQPR